MLFATGASGRCTGSQAARATAAAKRFPILTGASARMAADSDMTAWIALMLSREDGAV